MRRYLILSSLVAAAVVLSGCGSIHTNIDNPAPTSLDSSAFSGQSAIGAAATRVAADTEKLRPLSEDIYQKRLNGTNYNSEMKTTLEDIIPGWWRTAEDAAVVYKMAASSPDAAVAESGKRFAGASFDYARCMNERDQLSLGYVNAGLEWDSAYLTASREAYTNQLMSECEQKFQTAQSAEQEFSKTLATEAQAGRKVDPPATSLFAASSPAVTITVDGPVDASKKALVESQLGQLAGMSALQKSGGNLRVEVYAFKTGSSKLAKILIGPVPGINPLSNGGNVAFSAALTVGGRTSNLTSEQLPILGSDDQTLAEETAMAIVGQANARVLQDASGIR